MALPAKGTWRRYRGDILGGLTAAAVALPLALAFGTASGAGPVAGLYASIFGGLVAALTGGSELNVTGPTGSMTVVLTTLFPKYGVEGILLVTFMAGVLQLLVGLLGMGRFIKFLPHAVLSGFANGIAAVIVLAQGKLAIREPVIAAATVGATLLAHRYARRSIPAPLYGLGAGMLINELAVRTPHIVGEIPVAPPRPAFPFEALPVIAELIPPAITIFLVGSMESLLSAEIADAATGTRHNSNRELIGQGLANVTASLVGGIPVAGVVTRTAVAIRAGARSRWSSILHAIFLCFLAAALAPWAQRIPIPALAGILIVSAVRAADFEGFRLMTRARWTYGTTFLATLALTVLQNLIVAVVVGLALAGLFTGVDLVSSRRRGGSPVGTVRVRTLPSPHPGIHVVVLEGPLLFVGAEKLLQQLGDVPKGKILILDLSALSAMDESGALMVRRLAQGMEEKGGSLYIVGLDREPLRLLIRMGIVTDVGRQRICGTREGALRRAMMELAASPRSEGGVQ